MKINPIKTKKLVKQYFKSRSRSKSKANNKKNKKNERYLCSSVSRKFKGTKVRAGKESNKVIIRLN